MRRAVLFIMIVTSFSLLFGQTLAEGDSLYEAKALKKAERVFKAILANGDNYEATWKLTRTIVDIGNVEEDDDEREKIYRSALSYADKAIALNPKAAEGYFVKAMAVGKVALEAGTQEKIELSAQVKLNAERAIERDPNHDGALHTLARWHREVANLNWFKRNIAEIVYGGMPSASNEEAVKYFKRAISIRPEYIRHHFELAKTYEMMDKDDLARKEYEACLKLPELKADDAKAKIMAKEALENL
jgi:tetratricopeptide (TPR) repeat protein